MAFPFGGGTANSPAAAYEPLLGEKKKAFGKRKSKIGKKKSKGRKSASGKRNQPVYEALEPRLLLSADLTYGAYTDLTLQYDGVDTFELVHDVDGTVSSATRDLTDDRIVIAGTSGDDQLTLNWGSLGSETIVFDNPEDDFDILSITADGDFTLTENEITINGKTVTVTGFEAAHLTGGSGDTTMNVAGFAGQANLHGGGGKNTLKVQADSDISLDDSNLNLGGKAFGLSGFTHADLTGGASANQLNASGFSGNTILRGLGGADSLFGGSGNDIFIDDGDADVLSGGLGTDTLTGGDLGGVWNLTSLDSGTKDAASFSGIENLLGGTGTDIFNFVDGAGVSGSLDGGGGSDTLDYSGRSLGVSIDLGGGVATDVAAFTGIENLTGSAASDTLTGADTDNSWNLTGADAGTVGAVTFSGIETLAGGSGTDTLVGTDSANTWTLTGTDEGTVGAVAFTGIENLTGGAGDDTFQLTGSGGLTGTLAGGAGTDTLVGADTDNTWEITGANAGNLNGLLFSDMENLTGGAGADTFKFIGTGSISGIIDGGGGLNVLDYSQSSTAAAVNLAESAASGTGQIANIGGVTGSAGDDTLRGLDTANVWNLTGLDTGTVGAFTFTDVENLEGGTAEDVFNIDPSGDLTGLISGGLGEDTLAGADQLNTWEVTGEDDGSLNGLPFLDIENLLGGSDEDQFLFAIGGFVSGAFSGGLGADRLRGANQRNTWRVKGSNSGQLNDQDFSGIENLEGGGDADDFFLEDAGSLDGGLSGGAGDDTLYGPSPDTTWNVTGTNAGNVAGVSFTDTESLTGAADNEDTFVIGPGASVSGLIEGGDAGFDTIVIQPGDYTEKIYTATGPQSGSISLDGTVIQYAGVEPLTDLDGDANIIVFNLTAGNDTDATLTSSSATDFTLDGSTFELTNFTVTGATTSVTINLGSGNDTITLDGLSGTNIDNILTIQGGLGDDTIKLDDDWGVGVTLEETGGEGTDTLDFGPFSDGTDTIVILPQGGGDIDIDGSDGSSLTLDSANKSFEDIINADIDLAGLTGTVQDEIVGGLEDLVDFIKTLADLGGMAATLPLIGGNAEVAVSKALDLAESIDEIRLEVERFFNDTALPVKTTGELLDYLNGIFDSSVRTLSNLGPSILSPEPLLDSIAAGDEFEFSLDLDGDTFSVVIDVDANPIPQLSGGDTVVTTGFDTSLGADPNNIDPEDLTLTNLVNAIKLSLATLPGTSGKIIADVRDERIIFQVVDPDLETFSVEGLQESISKLGFENAVPILLDNVQEILRDLGDLNLSVASGISLGVTFESGLPKLRFDVDYRADRTSEFFYNLGEEAQSLGLNFDLETKVEVEAAMVFDFQLGLGLTSSGVDFFLDIDELRAGLSSTVSAETITDLGFNIGFLDVSADGSLNLDAGITLDTTSFTNEGIADLTTLAGSLNTGNLDLTGSNGTGSPDFALTLNIEVSAQSDVGGFAATGSLTASGDPLASGANITLTPAGDFSQFLDFNNLNAAGVISLLGQLSSWLDGMSESELFSSLEIPFIQGGLDAILNLKEVLDDTLLFDDGADNEKDGSDKLVTDLNAALADSGLDEFIRAQGDGSAITLVAVDPEVTNFSITKKLGNDSEGNPHDDGGFTDLGFVNTNANASGDPLEIVGGAAVLLGRLSGRAGFSVTVFRPSGDVTEDVHVETADTDSNVGIGDDVAKLVDANNVATFDSAQELALRLADIITLGTIGYDTTGDVLTYDIAFTDVPLFSVELPTDFELDLSPIANIQSDTRLIIDAQGGVNLTLGFDLNQNPAGSSVIEDASTLESLGVDVKLEEAAVADSNPREVVGVLSGDASFDVSVNSGATVATVTILGADTENNITLDGVSSTALLKDINDAIDGTALNGKIVAEADGDTVVLKGIGATTQFTVTTTTADNAFRELGIQESTEATLVDGDLIVRAAKDVPKFVGQLSGDAVFTLNFSGDATPYEVTIFQTQTVDPGTPAYNNRNILDLINDVQNSVDIALSSSGHEVEVTSEGGKLVFTRVGATTLGSSDNFTITPGANANELGINGLLTSGEADMIITIDDGTQYEVILDDVTTILELKTRINSATSGNVTASITVDDPEGEPTPADESGTSLTLVDNTAPAPPTPASGNFMVDMANGSLASIQLGLLGTDANPLDDGDVPDGKIIGGTIGGATLLDRFFITAPDLTSVIDGSLEVQAGLLVEGIEVLNPGGTEITSDGFSFKDRHVGKDIVIKDVLGFNDGTYGITAVDEGTNTATLDGAAGSQGQVGGVGIIETGVQASADFGFVGINLDGTVDLGAELSLGFNTGAAALADGKLTLQELVDGLGDIIGPTGLMAPPSLTGLPSVTPLTVGDFGEIDLTVSLSSGSADFSALTGLLGASPNLNIQVLTLGDPFMKTRLEQASYTRVTDTQFTLTGDLTPHLPDGTTLRFVDSGTNHDVVLDAPVHVGGTTTVNVIPDGGFVLPADLSGLDDVILLPKVDISTTDLDELLNFEDFSFEDILAALQAFTAFLGQFEAFGFLDTDLPVLNESINDLLGYADDFLARVNEAQSNPAGNLQILEDKLNEAMGIAESSLQDLLGILGIVDPSMDDVFDLGFDAANDMLTFEFNVGTSFSEEFGFNIPGLDFGGDLLNLASSGGLFAEGAVMLTLALGIDLATFDISDPGASLFILDETGFDATLSVGGDDIAINAGVGPFALAIASLPTQNSFVQLDGTASAGLDSSVFTGGRVSFNSIFDNLSLANFDGTLGGTISGALPVFFPNDSIHLGTITVGEEVGADLGLLENIDSLFFKTEAGQVPTPNVDLVVDVHEIVEGITGFDLSNFDLFSNIFLAIDGLDTVLGFVQDLIGGQIGNFTLPLIGDDLAKGAGFIEDLRNDLIQPLRDAVETAQDAAQDFADPDKNIISALLFDLLGPGGLDILKPLDEFGDNDSPNDYIGLDTNLDDFLFNPGSGVELEDISMAWDVKLGTVLADLSTDIGFDLGIPGLGLETEGDITLGVEWELDLGFGLSFEDGFFFDVSDPHELLFDFDVTLPASIVGTLAFLELRGTDKSLDFDPGAGTDMRNTGLGATFKVDLFDDGGGGDGKIGFTEFGDLGLNAGVAASATAALGLELGLSGELFSEIFGEGAGDVIAGFPKVTSDFLFLWELGSRVAGGSLEDIGNNSTFLSFGDLGNQGFAAIQEGLQVVAFENVALDLGTFLSEVIGPIVDEVSKFTGPIQPIIDFITSNIPIIGQLGLDVTWLDLAKALAGDKFDVGLIESIAEIITLINNIADISGVGSVALPIGDFPVYDIRAGGAGFSTASLWDPSNDTSQTFNDAQSGGFLNDAIGALGGIENALSDLAGTFGGGSDEQNAVNTLGNVVDGSSAGGFSFPFLEDPTQIFGLLMGNPIDLVVYDMAPLELEFEFSQFFSIFGPLGVSIGLIVEVMIDTAFGYDSQGIQDFVEGGFRNPLDLFNGFFISDSPKFNGVDDPELVFGAQLVAAAELNLGVAKAGVAAAFGFQILFDLFDPNNDMKIRISEIIGNIANQLRAPTDAEKLLAPLAIFDVRGEIFARLFAFLDINLGFFSFSKEFPIFGPVTLLSFEIDFFRPPILASEQENGDLLIHTGEFGDQRLLGNATDISEHIIIESNGTSGDFVNVRVKGGGLRDSLGDDSTSFLDYQVKKGSKIIIDGGEGNDLFDLTGFTEDEVLFEIDGGSGDDEILLAGAAATGVAGKFSTIRGGRGDDTIQGSGGNDIIIGGLGNDNIMAGDGDDLVFGDEGEIGTDSVRADVAPTDGADTIDGEDGEDILIGGGGSDTITGGATMGDDLLIGGGGVVFFEPGELKIFENIIAIQDGGVDDTLNSLFDSSAGDDLTGGWGSDIIYGTDGSDTLVGGGDADIIFGFGGADDIDGLEGNDIIFGDGGMLNPHAAGSGTSDGGNSDGTTLHDTSATFLSNVDIGDYLWNVDEGKFVRVVNILGDNELVTDAVDDWSGDEYRFFTPVATSGGSGDEIQGGDGHDLIFGGGGNDLIQGGEDDDIIFGGAGADKIFGDLGHVDGGTGQLIADSGSGADKIFGEGQPDKIQGGDGIDQIDGGAGADIIKGGGDNDLIIFNKGSDFLDGEEGGDTFISSFQGGNSVSFASLVDTGGSGVDVFVVVGTIFDDQFLLRANNDGSEAFVAMINNQVNVERINYNFTVERIVVNGSLGDDHFAVDDTAAEITMNGELGNDTFQVGQLFRSQRTAADANISITPFDDQFATIETTRGFLSNGISAPMTINGGLGDDNFTVFHNKAVLQLNGGEGDDIFEIRAFALAGSQEPQRERTDITGGAGADLVQYAVNAPVNIDGGDGFDTLVVIGTEFGDDFVITENGVFGAGLNVNFVNIESLRVDGAEGNDRFFVKSTGENFITEIFGGLGEDTFNMSGDTPPIVSNDLLGHSGIILQDVESNDPRFDDQTIFGISANVADNDEPFAVIRQTGGSTIVTEGSSAFDSYEIVLTREPDTDILVNVLAPIPTPDDRERRAMFFRVDSPDIDHVLEQVDINGSNLTLVFTPTNWFIPQEVQVYADDTALTDNAGLFTRPDLGDNFGVLPAPFDMNDDAFEGLRFGVINHLFRAAAQTFSGTLAAVDNEAFTATISDLGIDPDDLLGRKIFITNGPGAGQSRFIVGVSDLGADWELTYDRAFSEPTPPDNTSEYFITIDDALVGKMSSFDESPVGLPPTDNPDDQRSTFTDSSANFPTAGEGLTGAILEIVGGPGSGQQRLILGHLPGDETQTLILNGPWRTDPVAGESIYRIERYDGLAIPSVQVQINDNDQAGLILDETQGIENLNNIVGDWDTITALIEGGDGDYLGEKDVVQVRLSAQPAGDVTVNLLFNGTQLNLTDLGGTPLSSLQFTNGNWDTFQPVVVEANADLLREGFHTSLIEFQIESSDLSDPVNDGNFTLNQVDEFESIPEEAPVFFVGLSHTPTAINSVTLNDLPLTEADSEGLNGNFIVLSNKIVFVDNSGQPVAVNGQIDVDFDYLRPGFDTALLQPILARISDSDAPTVLVRETDGSTDVIEVKTGGADPESISPLAFAILNFLHPTMWNDSYELVLTGQPTDDVTITVTPDITKTTRTGGIRHDLVQVEISSADGRVVDNLDGTLTVTFTSADDDWNKPVVIDVTAIDDGVVDGGDTKEFAPGPNTLSRILGPVVVEGAGGQGSLGIGAPVMLPGETNVKIKTGDVVSVAGTEVTVLTADLVAILADFELLSVDELVNKTIEVTAALVPLSDPGDFVNLFHSSVGQFRLITDVTDLGGGETKLTINEPYDLNLGDNTDELESDIFSYAITAESLNFFVDETTQVDVMFVHDEDSPADSEGWLTPTRLFGLNLGPDLVIGGQRRSGGITYGDLEVVDIDLGTGNNTFHVMGTHTREDGYQTWTLLNTGDDVEWFGVQGDTVNVHLNAVDETTATGTVATAQNVDADLGIFETTVTLDQSFADGELVGQLVNIVAGGLEENGGEAIGQSRRILDNSGFEVTVDGVWEFIPNGENYEIINEADGAFAVNTQGGDDTVDASSSSLGIVMFGGLGDDTLMGGSGNDIIFGDRGRVDYFNNDGAIVTRLGFAPEPILGFVTTQVIDDPVSLVTIEDSGASFPVPDEVADGVGTEDIGLEGLFVDINNGAGFLQTIRLITGNTADTLTISEPFDTDLDLPGPVPGNESEYRISTIPEDQTDGVIREANLLITVDNDLGGVDDIDAGEGDDQVFGGAGGDDIDAGVGEDVVVGDGGRLDRSRDPAAMDDQFESELGAVVIGTFMDRLRTISFADGGVDTLRGSAGRDFILGGQSGDIIFGDGVYGASPDTGDVIIGDNGEVDFADGLVNHIFTTDTTELTGGADTILGDDGDDIILGGVNGSSDDISGNDGDDIILGDNGELIYDDAVDPDLSTLDVIQTFLDGDGGSDTISGDAGSDIILGGSGGDTIYGDDSTGSNGTDDLADFIVGDNGRFDLTTNLIAQIVTTDVSEATGGADTISGNAGDDVILGGVNGSSDVLSGDDGDDILLGDNGQLIYDDAVDTDLGTLDIVHSFVDGRGGRDEMSGGAGRDILIGGMGGDLMYGDDDTGSNGTDDLTDFMLGDNGRFDLLNNLIAQIQTTDISEATGGADTMIGNADDDVMVGGVNDGGTDEIRGNDGEDVILGDNGLLVYNDAVIDPATPDPDLSTLDFVTTQDVGLGGRDVIFGHADDDLILAGRGNDWVHAGSENDIVFGDFAEVKLLDNLARYAQTIDRTDGGVDTIFGNEGEDVLVGGANDDRIDGDEGRDLIFGDNVELDRFAQTDFDDSTNPRYRTLLPDGVIYGEDIAGGTDGQDLIDNGQDYENPNGATVWENWEINILDHSDADETAGANNFGDDYIAGGAQDDTIFAQLGDDVIQGDGSIDSLIDDAIAVNAYRDNDGFLHVTPSFEAESDGDDYIEGNGGDDVVFGGLGQDDIIGGNSDLFSLDTPSRRPDGSDMIFGGAGTDGSRNHLGDETAQGHARDADMILGDNGDIFRVLVPEIEDEVIVGFQFATFNYDDYTLHLPEADQLRIVPRAARLLDYSVGGPDLNGGPVSDIGGADEIHGESGDDSIYGMMDGDALYGDGQDDDMIGGWGNDWLSGGTGIDGMLGDDGRIYTSRNTEKANNSDTELSEPLFGIAKLEDVDLLISTPGNIQQAVINVDGELKKSVNLAPFNVDDNTLMQDPLFNPFFADDIMFGGWGMDFMHGGAGDDAMSGAEALGLAKVKVFPDDGTTDDARNDFTIEETGFDRPVNPGNVLGANALRAEEFAAYLEYDPWAKITVDGDEFFLNFDHTEGPLADPATGVVNTDGDDRIFGDLGNDWIVGGTGKDRAYGGRGNDLMNMDDDHSTNGGANDMPDGPELSYEDIAYGGAGRDVLIANTGGDRLIDWIGEFNSYVVPFAPFGAATVSRTLQPQLPEYLYDLSESDGVDMTRAADTGNAADRNGEPDGELGLVLQKDADWNAQTGAPDDPQAGNIPGGARDVLTGANFNTGSAEGFFADSGTWTVSSGEFQVAPETLGEDAVSVFHVDEYLPTYFELRATVNGGKPTAGLKSNAYLIFDYQSESNFKFAGVNISTDKLEIGYRDADGWQVVEQTPAKLKPETDYDLLLALNGTNATLVVDNKDVLMYTFDPRVDADGWMYGLNEGMVGIGANNSTASIDDVIVQVLPPEITFQQTDDFSGSGVLFGGETIGAWQIVGSRYEVDATGGIAQSLTNLSVSSTSVIRLEGVLNTHGTSGYIFDRYSSTDFKFAAISADGDKVIIGHHTSQDGWTIDAEIAWTINSGEDYSLDVTLAGSTVSVLLNGQTVLSHAFNSVVVDGASGIFANDGLASFDSVTWGTDDPALEGTELSSLMAAEGPIIENGSDALTPSQLSLILDAAANLWRDALDADPALVDVLNGLVIQVVDLNAELLGQSAGDQIFIDVDAAGHGWFVDNTPYENEEFLKIDGRWIAPFGSDAFGRMDLLTVVGHEIGHFLGLEHNTEGDHTGLMDESLASGIRHTIHEAVVGLSWTETLVLYDYIFNLLLNDELEEEEPEGSDDILLYDGSSGNFEEEPAGEEDGWFFDDTDSDDRDAMYVMSDMNEEDFQENDGGQGSPTIDWS